MNEIAMKTIVRLLGLAVLLIALSPLAAHGDGINNPIPSFYEEPGLSPNHDYSNGYPDEHIDTFTGKLQLHYVDLFIPGNGGFNLKVQRSYTSPGEGRIELTPLGAGWTMHFGRILTSTPLSLCTGGASVLELPDGSRQVLYLSSLSPMDVITTNYWAGKCSIGALTIYSPDGMRYVMDTVGAQVTDGTTFGAVYTVYPSTIIDRNGNSMSITYYNGGGIFSPATVTTTDGRRLDFAYSGSSLTSVSDGHRSISYVQQASAISGISLLTTVNRPDGTSWTYDYATSTDPSNNVATQVLSHVTYPTGGIVGYTFGYMSFGGNIMPRSVVVSAKQTTEGSWTYSYQPATQPWPCSAGDFCVFDVIGHPEEFDITTVQGPEGTTTDYHFGYYSAGGGSTIGGGGTVWLTGSLIAKNTGNQQWQGYSYMPLQVSPQSNWRPYSLIADLYTYAPTIAQKLVNRYGQEYDTTFSNFDDYGNPQTIAESGTDQRSTNVTYALDPSRWLIRLKKDETTNTIGSILRSLDTNGNVTTLNRYGVATQFTYTQYGDISGKVDANSNPTTYGAYYRGIPLSEAQPEGVTIQRGVDEAGNVISQTDGTLAQTTYTYDGLNRLTSIVHPTGNPVSITWTPNSRTVTRGGYTEYTTFDGFGRPLSVKHSGGVGGDITQTYVNDVLGRRIFASYPNMSTGDFFAYTRMGQPIWVVHGADPGGQTGITGRSYYYAGNTIQLTNERGKVFTYAYRGYSDPDKLDLMSVAAPETAASQTFTRNGLGQVTSVTQDSRTRNYTYNGHYFLTSATDPEIGMTAYGRDNVGNMTSRQVGAGANTAFGYDGRNRLTSITYSGGAPSVSRGYYADDKVQFVDNGVARRDYLYNKNKDLTLETLTIGGQPFAINYGYDGNDALATITYGSGKIVSYAPDALGWPTVAAPYINSVTHHPTGQIVGLTYANGVQTTVGFNVLNWPYTLNIGTNPAAPLFNQKYYYDGNANVVGILDGVDYRYSRGMAYDGIDRPTTVNGPWGSGTLAYDGHGNIQQIGLGSFSMGYLYDTTSDRLTTVNGSKNYGLTYDTYGNTTCTHMIMVNGVSIGCDPNATFSYNDAAQLHCAKCGTAGEIDYDYDGLDLKVRAQQNGVTTYFIHDSSGKLLWEKTLGVGTKEYFYLGGKQVATRQTTP
jgi:YD repeat-containing protein